MSKGQKPSVRDRFAIALERSRDTTGNLSFEIHRFIGHAAADGFVQQFICGGGFDQIRIRILGVTDCVTSAIRVAKTRSVNDGWEEFLSLLHGYFEYVPVSDREAFANGFAEVFDVVSDHCTSDNVPLLTSAPLAD